jgi:hypothetical protein
MKPEKVDKMDDENYRDLVLKLWELCNALEAMQKLLNKSFFNEFLKYSHKQDPVCS